MPTERKGNVTIYEVAAEAGVAISTVSKVLSNKSGISAATRLKVQQAVEQLGYVPSLSARGLTGGQTGIIGLIYAFPPEKLFTDPYLLENLLGIEDALIDLDYNLLISTGRESDLYSSFDRMLRSRYFDGVIIMETTEIHTLALHTRLKEQNLPWVVMGYPGGIQPCYAVYANDFQGGQMVAGHLLGLGHRRFAVIDTHVKPSGVDERLRGFRQVLEQHGVSIDPACIYYGDFTQESGYRAAPSILDRPDRPTAIFSVNDRMALGVLKWAEEHGIAVPCDVSVTGFDDIAAAAISNPPLTTIRQPGIQIGRAVVDVVHRLIQGETPALETVCDTELVVRGTSGEARKC
ncbi:MAG: LacI family transcriptional regulator [Chloroflexi bacterium]|nr:MAG: LacI family transcriptional regulator [Chloroflexota bacterium]